MKRDELFDRRIYKLRNDLTDYITNDYLKEIDENLMFELSNLLDKWDRDRLMIDKITMAIFIEGKQNLKDMDKFKLDREISRELFYEYIIYIINNTDFKKLNVLYIDSNKKYNEIEIKTYIKDYLVSNIREIYNNKITSLNNNTIEIFKNKIKKII